MPDTLEQIVQRMLDANESEENIAAVIQAYGSVAPRPTPAERWRAATPAVPNQGGGLTATIGERMLAAAPAVGGFAGGTIGAGAGGPAGAVGGAMLGGATGKAVQRLGRTILGTQPQAASPVQAVKDIGTEAAKQAAWEAGGQGLGAGAAMIGRGLKRMAVPMVRAGLKPTVTAMRQQAGASLSGINAQANKLAHFIIDNRITSAEKAQAIVEGAEKELQSVLQVKNPMTEAPKRVFRYLEALKRSAEQQAIPTSDVATIESAAKQMLAGNKFGRSAPTALDPLARAVRDEMPAKEALDTARSTSRWSTRKAWGEQKGAELEASKAAERALRDEVKARVPEAAPLLQREGQAITARQALDRAAMREGNRDVLSLPGIIGVSGHMPILGVAAQWLRNNQRRAGIWADQLGKAINAQDVATVARILSRLGMVFNEQGQLSDVGTMIPSHEQGQ